MPFSRKTTAAAALGALLAAGSAAAGNWTFEGTTFERLEADSNLRLNEDGEPVLGTISGIELELGYDARRTEWLFGSGANYRQYLGAEDAEELEGFTSPRASAAVVHRGKRRVIEAEFDVLRQPVAFSELDQVEIIEETANETRVDAATSWSWLASPLTTFSLGADLDLRRFSDEGTQLAPSTSIQFFGGWDRRLDPRTEAGLNLVYRYFQSDGTLTDLQTDAVTLLADASRRLTPQHTISVSAGLGRLWTNRETLFLPEESDTGLVFQGDLDFAWLGPNETEVVLTAAHSLEPSAVGTLSRTTTVLFEADRPLTPRTSFLLEGSYLRRNSDQDILGRGSARGQVYETAAGLSTDLTPRWDAATGIRLRYLDDEEGSAHSGSIFFELRRDLILNR